MDRLLYVDGFVDVARAYVLYGDFWISLPVALSAPLQLLALVLEGVGTVEHSQLGIMQVGGAKVGAALHRTTVLHAVRRAAGWTSCDSAWQQGRCHVNAKLARHFDYHRSLCLCAGCGWCGSWCSSAPCSSANRPSGVAQGQGRALRCVG